jgi:hypothetical protein
VALEARMQLKLQTRLAVLLTCFATLLCIAQAGIWVESAAHTKSQTAEQNKEIQHPPDEIPGLAGFGLLVVTGVLLSIPPDPSDES